MERNPLSLESLIPTLQLAIGPVILVSGVGIHGESVEYNPVSGQICVWNQSDPDVGVTMYKASFKEPDSSLPPRCPRCGADGLPVGPETLRAHLASDAAESLGEPAYWCATDACPIAYFDLFERSVDANAAHGLYWPKDPAGPLCCCHGLTVDDVDADLAEPVPSRVRAVVQKAGQPDAACTTKSPDGRPCVARVQRYYMQQKQKG
jgi:hypothetical protein